MRGTGAVLKQWVKLLGIIPACAGNRIDGTRSHSPARDHPRVCGEQCLSYRKNLIQRGIIPACAGNSNPQTSAEVVYRDHPRVCGEQRLSLSMFRSLTGSSPRVRGTGSSVGNVFVQFGIIPACAGNRTQLIIAAIFG